MMSSFKIREVNEIATILMNSASKRKSDNNMMTLPRDTVVLSIVNLRHSDKRGSPWYMLIMSQMKNVFDESVRPCTVTKVNVPSTDGVI
jgi:hypothetical protein